MSEKGISPCCVVEGELAGSSTQKFEICRTVPKSVIGGIFNHLTAIYSFLLIDYRLTCLNIFARLFLLLTFRSYDIGSDRAAATRFFAMSSGDLCHSNDVDSMGREERVVSCK